MTIKLGTSCRLGPSGSNMRTTWPMRGRLLESGSTHLRAASRALLSSLVLGLASMVGSTTSSDRRFATIIFSQSTRFTYSETE